MTFVLRFSLANHLHAYVYRGPGAGVRAWLDFHHSSVVTSTSTLTQIDPDGYVLGEWYLKQQE